MKSLINGNKLSYISWLYDIENLSINISYLTSLHDILRYWYMYQKIVHENKVPTSTECGNHLHHFQKGGLSI